MTTKLMKWTGPPTAILLLSAAIVFGAVRPQTTAPLQKRRVVAQGRLTGTRDLLQIITWQTANPPRTSRPYAQAHLAIEAPRGKSRIAFQVDGGETQYLVDRVQIADLDGDGVPEIISLWQEGASAGSRLRVFHWDRARQTFIELKSQDDLAGIHAYRISPARGARHVVIYSRTISKPSSPVQLGELAVRGAELVRVNGRDNVRTQTESGIEGRTLISPTRPGPTRVTDPPDIAPYPATLAIISTATDREVARLKTGSDGRFRVALPPGEYRVVYAPERPGRMLPHATEELVRVLPGQFAHVEIHFDSGMR
ncbi:MAG TPA: carboxypeptidase-like regulatory domain-containing protein [Blastocatellia bacterium]|nr:carboxypeptidase-like regulatory domain-containing protein [Blastocatellia bacterium]